MLLILMPDTEPDLYQCMRDYVYLCICECVRRETEKGRDRKNDLKSRDDLL